MSDRPDRVHDTFFAQIFEEPAHAAAELRAILPAEVVEMFRWESLSLERSSFKGQADANRQCDLLFSVRRRDTDGLALVYVLFEHQSTDDPLMPLRMLRYMLGIWNRWLRERPQTPLPLPPILPVVLSHDEAGWRSARSFHELFATDPGTQRLRRFIPDFELVVDDLAALSDEALAARKLPAMVAVALWVLRDARTPERLLAHVRMWASRVRELGGHGALIFVFEYVEVAAGERSVSADALTDKLAEFSPDTRQVVMSSLQKMREESLQEGRQEGRQELLLRLLTLRFGQLTDGQVRQVQQADDATLGRYADRVLTADSVAAVLAD